MDKKRFVKIIVACIFLLASCILLLTFFIISSNTNTKPLSIYASNCTMYVDESLSNFYTVTDNGCDLTFDIENDTIVTIDDNIIYAHKPGTTKITIHVSKGEKKAQTSIYVTVYARSYSYIIIPVDGCSYDNNSLILHKEICQFSLNIFNELNNKVEINSIKFDKPEDVVLQENISSILLVARNDCTIFVNVNNDEFIFEIHVSVQF